MKKIIFIIAFALALLLRSDAMAQQDSQGNTNIAMLEKLLNIAGNPQTDLATRKTVAARVKGLLSPDAVVCTVDSEEESEVIAPHFFDNLPLTPNIKKLEVRKLAVDPNGRIKELLIYKE